MSDAPFTVAFKGMREAKAELHTIMTEGDLATAAAVKASAQYVRRNIQSRMRGKPRWNHRGASKRTGPEINVPGPAHAPRGGGPGMLTGTLRRGVRVSRRPRKVPSGYSAAVIIGSKDTKIRNLYKGSTERNYPYWAPGVEASRPGVGAIWNKAWTRVINKHR